MAGQAFLLENRDGGTVVRADRAGRSEQQTGRKQYSESHWFDIYLTSFGANGTYRVYSVEMTFGVRCISLPVLICGTLAAQDITGRWTGVADTTDEGATKRQEQQSFEVKMTDGKLAAVTIGKDGKPGAPIQIQQDGAKFNFYRFLDFEGGEHLRWKLELKDGKLVGRFQRYTTARRSGFMTGSGI